MTATQTTQTIADDQDCTHCGVTAQERTCEDCGVTAMITDCGCQSQPRPIAPDGHHTYCDACYDARQAVA